MSSFLRRLVFVTGDGKADFEVGALSDLALRLESSAVGFDDFPSEVKANAHTARSLGRKIRFKNTF